MLAPTHVAPTFLPMTSELDLSAAITRLKAFRAPWNDGDVVDDVTRLTADDLDAIIAQVEFDLIT